MNEILGDGKMPHASIPDEDYARVLNGQLIEQDGTIVTIGFPVESEDEMTHPLEKKDIILTAKISLYDERGIMNPQVLEEVKNKLYDNPSAYMILVVHPTEEGQLTKVEFMIKSQPDPAKETVEDHLVIQGAEGEPDEVITFERIKPDAYVRDGHTIFTQFMSGVMNEMIGEDEPIQVVSLLPNGSIFAWDAGTYAYEGSYADLVPIRCDDCYLVNGTNAVDYSDKPDEGHLLFVIWDIETSKEYYVHPYHFGVKVENGSNLPGFTLLFHKNNKSVEKNIDNFFRSPWNN